MDFSKITTIEAIMMIITIVVPYTVITLPKTLVNEMSSGIIINIIFVTILALIFTNLICNLFKKFPGSDILDIAYFLGGKSFKKIVGFIFIFYFIISSSIILRNFSEGLKTVYYPYTHVVFIVLMFILSLAFVNKLKFNSTLKATSLVLPFVFVSILFLFFGNLKNFRTGNLYPVIGESFYNTFLVGMKNIGIFGGISYIYFLPPLLKNPNNFKKISLVSILMSGLFILTCVTIILFIFSSLKDSNDIMPLFTVCRYIEFSIFFQRFESLILLIWTISFCCYLSIACKIATSVFVKINNLSDNNCLTYIFDILIFGVAMFPKTYAISIFFENNIYRYLRILFALLFGILILIFANKKKKTFKETG